MSAGLTIALAKGRILDATLEILSRAGIEPVDDLNSSRKLVFSTNQDNINLVLIRSSDVPTYVQYGAADLGIAGKDVLLEHGGEGLYEWIDLKIARCKLMTAGYPDKVMPKGRLKVATKYPAIARDYFLKQGRQVEIIKLYGSMELAPIVGLADIIVDLVETGNTLKANGLVPMDPVLDVSSRLVINRASLKMKNAAIKKTYWCYFFGNKRIIPMINRLETKSQSFWDELKKLLAFEMETDRQVQSAVTDILAAVRKDGDAAVVKYTNQFDRLSVDSANSLEVSPTRLAQALDAIPAQQRDALKSAADRIQRYAEKQKLESWQYKEPDGTILGQQISALDSVGLYVPGGKAAYPSSVLMNAVPAKVAGVKELIMVVPTPDGVENDMVFAAAKIAGVDRVFTIGGAQAVAALAYGTESIPAVDKIVGPGNIYVATAKRMVFGTVGIDMIAGPSEILVVCDGKTDPDWIAMDLFSQAEHDEDAQAILLSTDGQFLDAVQSRIERLLPEMKREKVISTSLSSRGALIHASSEQEMIDVANHIAPEHLELSVENAQEMAKSIRHAGAIFMGRYTAEALGDYCAGPNHVLPTSRTARFSSPLGVYDFQKRSSLIGCSAQGASDLGKLASILARGEGLTAHAQSAEYRIIDD